MLVLNLTTIDFYENMFGKYEPEEEPIEEEKDDNLDILRQIQQIKQDVPNSDDEEDEALIEKIKQLLDEFN